MLKARHKDLHPLLKVVEWLLIMLACAMLVVAIWHVLPINHAAIGSLLLFQALQAIALFILPALAVAWLWSEEPMQWLQVGGQRSAVRNQKSEVRYQLVGVSVGVMLTAIPLINCLVSWNQAIRLPESMSGLEQLMQQMEEQADRILQGFLTYKDGAWWVLMLNLLILAVLPAIGEELTFRGVLQRLISNQQSAVRNHVAVWVTAFIFAFVHFQFYGFIARMLLGAVLGYALVWSGNIGYSILMHATNNALSVIVFYLGTYVWHLSQTEIDAIGTGQTWWLTLVCTPVMCLLLYIFYRLTQASGHPEQIGAEGD